MSSLRPANSRFLQPLAFQLGLLLLLSANVKAASCLDGYALFSNVQTVLRDRDSVASGKVGSNGYLELGNDGKSHGDFVAKGNIQLKGSTGICVDAFSGPRNGKGSPSCSSGSCGTHGRLT